MKHQMEVKEVPHADFCVHMCKACGLTFYLSGMEKVAHGVPEMGECSGNFQPVLKQVEKGKLVVSS